MAEYIPDDVVLHEISPNLPTQSKAVFRVINRTFNATLRQDQALMAESAARKRIRRLVAPRVAYYLTHPDETVAEAMASLDGTALRDFQLSLRKFVRGAGGNNAYLGWTTADIKNLGSN